MAIIYGLKVNLSVAMVAMLNHTALAHNSAKDHSHMFLNATEAADSDPVCQASNSTEAMEVSTYHVYSCLIISN